MALCPAHDDRQPSLSISPGRDGRILCRCHGGCETSAIVATLGLTMADLMPETPKTAPKVVKTYDYRDRDGTLRYQAVRMDPKGFFQRRPDGKGDWIRNMQGVARIPYRLPDLVGQEIVWIVEGEKDADRLHTLGLAATTNVGGAGKWAESYTKALTDCGAIWVIILPDQDEAGLEHAQTIAALSAKAGQTVTVLSLPDLPPKGDVSDWLDAGHTAADLQELADATALWTPTALTRFHGTNPVPQNGNGHGPTPALSTLALTSMGDLLAEPDTAVDYLVEGLIQTGSVNVLAAKPKVGKSTLARQLALAVAQGDDFLGRACPARGTVWYLAFEGRRGDIRAHFRQMGATADDPLWVLVGQAPKDIVTSVKTRAVQQRPDLVIIDTMQRFLKAKSTDDYAEMTLLFDSVIGIAQASGAAILLLTHTSKIDKPGLDAILGSTAIAGSVDTAVLLTRTSQYRTISTVQRTGDDLDDTVLLLDADTGRSRLGGTRRIADQSLVVQTLYNVLAESETPMTQAELFERVEARRTAKLAALRVLLGGHFVPFGSTGNQGTRNAIRMGAGTRAHPYLYALDDTFLVPSSP